MAHAFAKALKNPERRSDLLQAFRASPYNEHKLVLQEFIATPAGQELVADAAKAARLTPTVLTALIAELPSLDMYVPSRAHRETWKGDEKLLVSLKLERNRAVLSGFDPQGNAAERRADSPRGFGAGPVVVLLHPAEAKGLRVSGTAYTPGDVIQDPGEEDLAITAIDYTADGDSVVTSFARSADGSLQAISAGGQRASFNEDCDPNTALQECDTTTGGGSGSGSSSGRTYLAYLSTQVVCDNYNCDEANEFEFRAEEQRFGVTTGIKRTLRLTGVDTFDFYYLNALNIYAQPVPTDGRTIKVRVVETDVGWPNPDDDFGPPPVLRNDNGHFDIQGRVFNLGDLRDGSLCAGGPIPPDGLCRAVLAGWRW